MVIEYIKLHRIYGLTLTKHLDGLREQSGTTKKPPQVPFPSELRTENLFSVASLLNSNVWDTSEVSLATAMCLNLKLRRIV